MATASKGQSSYLALKLKVQFLRMFQSSMLSLVGLVKGIKPIEFEPFETINLPSTKGNRQITVNAYRNAAALQPNVGPVAVHLNWHGSGFVLYSFGESKPFILHLCTHQLLADYPLVVLDCDYSKAPENPFPAALDDARDVLDYVFANPSIYDTSKVTLGGFSAGGNLALGTSIGIGEEVRLGKWKSGEASSAPTQHPVKAVIAYYPVSKWDIPMIPTSAVTIPKDDKNYPGLLLPEMITNIFDAAYWYPHPLQSPGVAAAIQRGSVSPAVGETRDFPPEVALITTEYDTLRIEAERLRERLKAEGKDVGGWMVKGVGHSWDLQVNFQGERGYKEKIEAYDLAAQVIRHAGGQ
ncbi:alpha/beta-hydrolase, partial [Serendipita vermifera]